MADTIMFTPNVNGRTNLRAYMLITREDWVKFAEQKESGKAVKVHDHASGNDYFVKSADCGLGCKCASEIVRRA